MSSDQAKQDDAKKWPEPKNPWERMVDCHTCKGRHFGLGGAAGMLLVRRDESKANCPVTFVILQHRSYTTTAGGTWGIPGGALDEGETQPRALFVRHPKRWAFCKTAPMGSIPQRHLVREGVPRPRSLEIHHCGCRGGQAIRARNSKRRHRVSGG